MSKSTSTKVTKVGHCTVIEYNGKSGHLTWWAQQLGMMPSSLLNRLRKHNWDLEAACKEPLRERRKTDIEYNGEVHTIRQWAKILGMSPETLTSRLAAGWSMEKAANTPVDKRKAWRNKKTADVNVDNKPE